MKTLNNDNNRKIALLYNKYPAIRAAVTIFALAIIFASSTISPVAASTTGGTIATTTATSPSSGLEFSAQPVWDETVRTTGIIPINETHTVWQYSKEMAR